MTKAQRSPLEMFFKLGDKVTKNPKQKADFDYYMMWIIFLAFFGVFLGNLWQFFNYGYQLQNLGWAMFGLAIMWFQYFNLKMMYGMRMMYRQPPVTVEEDDNMGSVKEMLESFKK